MKKQSFYVLMIMGIMFLTSCIREDSVDVNQDKIYTYYELFYNANQDKSYAKAIFKFSNALGTQLELTSPSEIKFDGDLLTFQSAIAYYEKAYVSYIQSGTFVWTDVNGLSYTNTIQNKTIALPASLDTIPRDAAFEIFWEGDSLSANEKVILSSSGVFVATQNNMHAKSVIIPLNLLQDATAGEYSIWLDRYYEPGLTEKTSAGGYIQARYKSFNKTVYLE